MITTHFPHLSKPQARVRAVWSLGMGVARSGARSAVRGLLAQWIARKPTTVRQQVREWGYKAPAKRGAKTRVNALQVLEKPRSCLR